MRLTQFCHLQLGYTARGRLDPVEGEGVRAIQLRDTAPEGGLNTEAIAHYRRYPPARAELGGAAGRQRLVGTHAEGTVVPGV